MNSASASPFDNVDTDSVPESIDVVTRKDIKPSRSSWFGELHKISFVTRRTVLVCSSLVILCLFFLSFMLYAVDRLTIRILSSFAASVVHLSNFSVISTLVASSFTIWISLRKPPPGGAGVLLGGNDEATWQTSTNFFFPLLALGILMTICSYFWFFG